MISTECSSTKFIEFWKIKKYLVYYINMIKDYYYRSYWRIWYDSKCENEVSYYFREGESDFSIMFIETCARKNKNKYCVLENKKNI